MDLSRKILLPAGVGAAFIGGMFLDDALHPILRETPLGDIGYAVSLTLNLIDLLVLGAVIAVFGGKEGRDLPRLSGLAAPMRWPALFALVIFAPAAAAAALIAKPVANLDIGQVVLLSLVFPLIEEVGFRAFAVGALMRIAKWPFIPAALLPAAVFGLVHAYQGDSLAEVAGVVALTGVGGIWFSWLFVRWSFNIWPAFFAHAGLNALWEIFNLGENAIGGWAGNVLRLGVIAATILFTLFALPRLRRPGPVATDQGPVPG